MRIVQKGGNWKNSEDEILKAALMKYGKNQWARISSLLVRKSAKQCKARWYEWLDPAIKKTEWTREEEEKLLHLAKILPTQWRSIAPMVGRTAAQCLEHYERLLDQAQQREGDADIAIDDPRRLRVGMIDPTPETKPAQPDPVDMDEDEKEMLQEARARLANTKGKKAKRKARERQLEEARRLASLQKRRELKAAGLTTSRGYKKKIQGIDYNAEIPFDKPVPAGFFDVSGEDAQLALQKAAVFKQRSLQSVTGNGKSERQDRERKQEERKHRAQVQANVPQMVEKIKRLTALGTDVRRGPLSLPAPQISDSDLRAIAKLGYTPEDVGGPTPGAASATSTLLARYTATPTPGRAGSHNLLTATPSMTPGGARSGPGAGLAFARTPARPDTVTADASLLYNMTHTNSALLGGANPILPGDFKGITPSVVVMQTPNALAALTPRAHATPAQLATPMRTPVRDELSINTADALAEETAREERQRQAAARKQVQTGLFKLPQPKNAYEIDVSADVSAMDTDEHADADEVEDAADAQQRVSAAAAAAEARRLAERSSSLRRGLPRTRLEADISAAATAQGLLAAADGGDSVELAQRLIVGEKHLIVAYDNWHYPLAAGAPAQNPLAQPGVPFTAYSARDMDAARELLAAEALASVPPPADFALQWSAVGRSLVAVPSGFQLVDGADASLTQRVELFGAQLRALDAAVKNEQARSQKVERRLATVHGGYQTVSRALAEECAALLNQLYEMQVQRACFSMLAEREGAAAPRRVAALKAEVEALQAREAELQSRYALLTK